MDTKSLRLFLFLTRYIEGIGRASSSNLSPQDAALLTSIHWGELHPQYQLNQTQMASLFSVKDSQVSERLKPLRRQGLYEVLNAREKAGLGIEDERTKYLRLTAKGLDALEAHATLMFELPAKADEELQRMEAYSILINRLREILDRELPLRFEAARKNQLRREPGDKQR